MIYDSLLKYNHLHKSTCSFLFHSNTIGDMCHISRTHSGLKSNMVRINYLRCNQSKQKQGVTEQYLIGGTQDKQDLSFSQDNGNWPSRLPESVDCEWNKAKLILLSGKLVYQPVFRKSAFGHLATITWSLCLTRSQNRTRRH